MKTSYFIPIVAFLFFACSKSDDTVVLPPELKVSPILNTSYFQKGESPLPEVQWNGKQGEFGLENTLQGLSIDVESGQLSWDRSLPLGVHTVILFAQNNAGKNVASLTINNPFKGTFKGTYASSIAFNETTFKIMEMVFNADGTFSGYTQIELDNGDIQDPSYFNGTYVLNDDTMEGSIQYENSEATYPFEADLDTAGKLKGYYIIADFLDSKTTFDLNFKIQQ
ncbi:hypothetical protein [Zobellia uliginosa]|uniref:hypothetical protein n=1 Tax=Zobellia uliginosa TaxID=143224 RepID=UPI0026E16C50|nr:hypothetical protein [Zobellia uliginosa]MDO6518468.1 hypothetical protein [Zobellia uliginosa]